MTVDMDALFMLQEDMDEETLQAIIAVQLADLDEALAVSGHKGKGKAGDPLPESEYALRQYRDYLSSSATAISDAKLARSIDEALNQDALLIQESLQVLSDHHMALGLSEGGGDLDMLDAIPDQPLLSMLGMEAKTNLANFTNAQFQANTPGADPRLPIGYATSSGTKSGFSSSSSSLVKEAKCCSCLEDRYCVSAPCGDTYCHNCLKQIFRNACTDEELFPPRCHRQEIPLYLAQPFLLAQEIATLKAKREEYTTHNRTYCSNQKCITFIPAKNIENDCALCAKCARMTCVSCKQRYHGKTDCPMDAALDMTLELAAKKGWQRCQQCRALVERSYGCQHIKCKCGADFCYRCGLKWKTCGCNDWDQRALDRRAEELAIREAPRGEILVPTRLARRTREIRREIEEQHECEHDGGWTQRHVGNEACELCHDILPEFIWVCNGCQLFSCTRCKRNRI